MTDAHGEARRILGGHRDSAGEGDPAAARTGGHGRRRAALDSSCRRLRWTSRRKTRRCRQGFSERFRVRQGRAACADRPARPAPAYAVARTVAPTVAEHLQLHRAALPPHDPRCPPGAAAGCRKHRGARGRRVRAQRAPRGRRYIPKFSLAFLRPLEDVRPLMFKKPCRSIPAPSRVWPAAVERPGIHLGVCPPPLKLRRGKPLAAN